MIHVSDAGAAHIQKMLARRGKGIGIRVGVKTTGCSGLAYVLEYVDDPLSSDEQFLTNGVIVVVDPKHLPYIDEMTIDYVRNGLNEGFEFKNPIEKDRCGCGESFRV
jgi:iron-sulfur cluster assembly protein